MTGKNNGSKMPKLQPSGFLRHIGLHCLPQSICRRSTMTILYHTFSRRDGSPARMNSQITLPYQQSTIESTYSSGGKKTRPLTQTLQKWLGIILGSQRRALQLSE